MKITAARADLIRAVQNVHKGKSIIPILGGMLLEARGGNLTVTTTNLEVSIRCSVPLSVVEEGALCLPSRQLVDIIKAIPDDEVRIQSEGDAAKILYNNSQISLNGFSPEQFPEMPEVSGQARIVIPAKLLLEAVNQTVYATLKDMTRPIFTGVLFDCDKNLKLVATDAHRLALWESHIQTQATNVIVPAEALSEVAKIARNTEEVIIGIDNNYIKFEMGNTILFSKLIGGQYPNYQQVIPREFISVLTVKTAEFAGAVTRASLLLEDISAVVQITLNSIVTLSVDTPAGWIREKINASYQGDPIDIYFNAHYLIDALRAINSGEVSINFTSPLSAAVIKPASGDDKYLSLLLPARVNR